MKTIKTQSAAEAMDVYQRARIAGQQVKASGSGNIRAVRLYERIAESFRSLSSSYTPANWEAAAKNTIKNKLGAEVKLFKPELSNEDQSSLDQLVDHVCSMGTTEATQLLFKLGMKSDALSTALSNVRDMQSKVVKKNAPFIRPLLEKNHGNLDNAIKVAQIARDLKKEKGLSSDTALTTAYRIDVLMQRDPELKPDQAFEIILFAGRLVNEKICSPDGRIATGSPEKAGGFEKSEAMLFALDIWAELKQTNSSFSDLKSLANKLVATKKIPNDLNGKTKISAALCFLQLKQKGWNDNNALMEINHRLGQRSAIEANLPNGCKKDCIHNGAHIRAHYALDQTELKAFQKSLKEYRHYPLCSEIEIVSKAPKFAELEHQFGLDAVRTNFKVLQNGAAVPAFEKLETGKQLRNNQFTSENLVAWLDEFIQFAGTDKAASTLSRFSSQTIIGDVYTFAGKKSQTANNSNCTLIGETGTKDVLFTINKTGVAEKQKTTISITDMNNASMLAVGKISTNSSGSELPPPPIMLNLIQNAGSGKKAHDQANNVRYNAVIEVSQSDLESGKVTCTPIEVSVTYDLILDEDNLY